MDSESVDGYYLDSDTGSTTSSLIDFSVDLEQGDPNEMTMVDNEFQYLKNILCLDLPQQ